MPGENRYLSFGNFAPNQSRGINQQLADGGRAFQLDIHQTPNGDGRDSTGVAAISTLNAGRWP